jgi:magnesium transporter
MLTCCGYRPLWPGGIPTMQSEFSTTDIEQLLQERRFFQLREILNDLEPADVAIAIDGLEPEERAVVIRVLRREHAADTFELLSSESQEGLIKALARDKVATILNDMSPDDRTHLLEELPAAVTKQLLTLLAVEERKIAVQLLGYPEDSIGRLMTPEFIAVQSDWTIQETLEYIRGHGEDSETLNVIYVVDGKGLLLDDLRIRQLLLAEPGQKIADLLDGTFISLNATADQETAVQAFRDYDRIALPAIDSRGVLLGIVTVDDVLDVVDEEATEDIHKLGGSIALAQPFMQIGFFEMLRKRMGWLVLLFLGQLLTLNAMGFFADRIAEAIVLVLFVPLIISSGGNCGAQAATLVIRAMALNEVALADWWKVMRREIIFGVVLGLSLALIGFLRVGLGESLSGSYGGEWATVGMAVGIALICVVLWGVIVGSMLPFLLSRLGADPATSSAPFVTTVVDVTGLILYLSIATLILG